uniref:DnaJ domain-containing protein n=1 Tax=Candidatus Kentrum eta TaxID=2126337 RepID=A0A450UVT5_9GAMM|nr:MAG: DnaJ domain-containing protein [Candidatus Kentron sp. H]
MHPLLWLIVLVGLIVFFNWFTRIPKAARSRFINRILPIIAIGIGLFFLVRGLPPLLAAASALLPLLPRLIVALQAIKSLRSLGFILGFGRKKMSSSWQEEHNRNTGIGEERHHVEKMTIADAYKILELSPDSDQKDIIAAHRKLIQKLHPDRGGSTFLSTQINQAKDLLLVHIEKQFYSEK